ncbi:protein-serine/threonine phosphatase, partial [Pseudomonas sp. GW460-13]
RMGVGYVNTDIEFTWQNHIVPIGLGTLVFVTTDGLIDQIGGPKEIAFGKRRVRQAIFAHRDAPTTQIGQAVLDVLRKWQGQQ